MPDSPLPYPIRDDGDAFVVAQTRRMAGAHGDGDTVATERIRRHLVAEASTDPADEELFDQVTRASLLFKEYVEATGAGERDRVADLAAQLTAFPDEVVTTVRMGALFQVARQRGWLPAAQYDQLSAYVAVLGGEAAGVFAMVKRSAA
jgi:hypothetical protein